MVPDGAIFLLKEGQTRLIWAGKGDWNTLKGKDYYRGLLKFNLSLLYLLTIRELTRPSGIT
jgi:hypothetical protein